MSIHHFYNQLCPHWAHSHNWLSEMTRGNFEVEVLGIYGRRELCTHGSGAPPVSDGPYQPVDAADVRRRVVFGGTSR